MHFTRTLLIAGLFGVSLATVPTHALSFGIGALGGLNLGNAGIGGGGGAYQVRQYIYLTADARYSYGFTNSLKHPVGDIDSWKSRDIRMLLGILVHLSE